MSSSASCDLNSKSDILKVHDMCPKPKCKCRKQNFFTLRQFQPAGSGFKIKIRRSFPGTQTTWNKLSKPASNIASPYIGMPVLAKIKNQKLGEATSNILKSIPGGETSSPTDTQGNGLR